MNDLLTPCESNCCLLLGEILQVAPTAHHETNADRAFSVRTRQLLNFLRLANSLFKSLLRTHSYRKAFLEQICYLPIFIFYYSFYCHILFLLGPFMVFYWGLFVFSWSCLESVLSFPVKQVLCLMFLLFFICFYYVLFGLHVLFELVL